MRSVNAICLAMLALLSWTSMAQADVGSKAAQRLRARIEQIVQSHIQAKNFMGAVLVAKGDRLLLEQGYGSASLEWGIPNTPDTRFRIGSLTKQFTAAAILLLQEKGKLSLDDPISKYIPDAPAAWNRITLFHLLTHTSGIPNFTGFPDYASFKPMAWQAADLIAKFKEKPLDFEPGESWRYSNSGYVVLGYIIEQVSGESYARFMADAVFAPLGMANTGYDTSSVILSRRASGYAQSAVGLAPGQYIDISVPFAAGGLYSTVGDLAIWERALFNGKLLSPTSLVKMTTPIKADYAMGLLVKSDDGHLGYSHTGGIDGFTAQMAYYPQDKVTVIVLGNVESRAPKDIAMKIAAAAHEEAEMTSPR